MAPIEDLIEFLRFNSISADPQYRPDTEACADWLLERFRRAGLDGQKFTTPGNPVVLARNAARPERKTLLIYGHYDVQPVDPIDLWESPPFEPLIKDGRIIARGATDNKGQILAHLLGAEAYLRDHGDLPVNLIFLVEGEEEVGSSNLDAFLEAHQQELAADIVAVSDTGMVGPGIPTFTYGLRGIKCLEVHLTGPSADLHSGIFGGAVANPATVLSRILASLVDAEGRVTIPNFYDRVRPLESWESELWQNLQFDEKAWLANTGAPALSGEQGHSTLERIWSRPTMEINGLNSGYQGAGPKTIVPSRAIAKLSFRLVPDQEPEEVFQQASAYLQSICPSTVRCEIIRQHGGKPYLTDPNSAFGLAARQALEKTFSKPVAFIREGGSIPIVQSFRDVLHADTLLLGLALPDAKAHSPNENFPVENFEAGIRLNQNLLRAIAEIR